MNRNSIFSVFIYIYIYLAARVIISESPFEKRMKGSQLIVLQRERGGGETFSRESCWMKLPRDFSEVAILFAQLSRYYIYTLEQGRLERDVCVCIYLCVDKWDLHHTKLLRKADKFLTPVTARTPFFFYFFKHPIFSFRFELNLLKSSQANHEKKLDLNSKWNGSYILCDMKAEYVCVWGYEIM